MHESAKGSRWVITKILPSDSSVVKIGVISLRLEVVVFGSQMQIRFPHVFSLQRRNVFLVHSKYVNYVLALFISTKDQLQSIGHFGDFIIV